MKNGIKRSRAKRRGKPKTEMQRSPRTQASGRFVLRLEPTLHALVRDEAAATGMSLNDRCVRTLAVPSAAGIDGLAEVILAIRARLGGSLIGVVAYGSFARDALAAGSDVDLLVVIERDVPITRSLYRDWDRIKPTWHGREVDLHFAHLPEARSTISGTWAEVAVGGIVLFERDLVVSRRLIEFRTRIAAGEFVRKLSQGQPYWIHESPDAQP
jgi:predicted nucleotidyltransferase